MTLTVISCLIATAQQEFLTNAVIFMILFDHYDAKTF